MRVIVAEDETMARRRLLRLLEPLDVDVVAECTDGAQALRALREEPADLALLDVNMPELTGVDAAKLMGEDGPLVVFVTAHAEHAVDAFAAGAVDYLLKPVDAARLKKALDRARDRLVPSSCAARLPIPTRSGVEIVDPDTVVAAVIDGASVLVHTTDRTYVTAYRLVDVERRLDPDRFLRVHRQALIGLDHLDRLEDVDSGGYIAHLGEHRVAVSRASARTLRRRWSIPK